MQSSGSFFVAAAASRSEYRCRCAGACELTFELQHQSFCSLFADAGDFGKESGLSPIDSVFKLIDRDARKECQRDLRTDAGNLDERTEHSAFGECGKAVKKLCILANDEVRVERELSADFREIAKC